MVSGSSHRRSRAPAGTHPRNPHWSGYGGEASCWHEKLRASDIVELTVGTTTAAPCAGGGVALHGHGAADICYTTTGDAEARRLNVKHWLQRLGARLSHIMAMETYLRRVKDKVRHIYIRDSYLKEDLGYHRKTDPTENQDTSPPENESIELKCFWAVEFYTPAHTDNLVKSFTKLGWNKEESAGGLRNPITWIYELRRYHRGNAWTNLGLLIPSNAKPPILGRYRKVPLPSNIKYALAGLHSLSPSLVCIVVCFVFKEDASGVLDEALRAEHSTDRTRTRSGWIYHTPTDQKQEAVRQIRTDLSQLASKWFSENLPGLFSSGLLEDQLPTCELITTSKAIPFGPFNKGEEKPRGYRWILGIDQRFGTWEHKGDLDLKLSFPTRGESSLQHHAILAVRTSTLNDSSALQNLNLTMSGYLSLWAVLPMLEGYTRRIREIRDSTALTPNRNRDSVKTLDILRKHLSNTIDVAAVSAELRTDVILSLRDPDGFKFSGDDWGEDEYLGKSLDRVIGDHAKWLSRTDEALRDQLTQYGSLLGASEGVRLQKKIGGLTWVLVAFTWYW